MIPTPEQAYALVCDYNEGEFHRKHARIVGDVILLSTVLYPPKSAVIFYPK